MSSIDKGVERYARSICPDAYVTKAFGVISVHAYGKVVARLSDRYGYINESERAAVSSAMSRAYESAVDRERLAEEMRRREEERRENERRAAIAKHNGRVTAAVKKAESARAAAAAAVARTLADLKASEIPASVGGHDLSAFSERAAALRRQIEQAGNAADAAFKRQLRELESCRLPADAQSEEIARTAARLQGAEVGAVISLPSGEVERLREEKEKVQAALGKVSAIEDALRELGKDEQMRGLAETALRGAEKMRIASAEDVSALAAHLQEQIAQARSIGYEQRAAAGNARISRLNGLFDSCVRLRRETETAAYKPLDVGQEAAERAALVQKLYAQLEDAPFTTCDAETRREASRFAQEIAARGRADEEELERLNGLIDAFSRYKTQDKLQESNYADYCRKVRELQEFGLYEEYASLVKAFDPLHYGEQREQLTELLIAMDERLAAARTEETFVLAYHTMEKLGYKLLRYDLRDGLAYEAIFVRPGCKGVAWQVIASDCGLQRRLVGIRRENGMKTPPERALEVARLEEEYGTDMQFYQEYNAACGDTEVTRAVLSDTEGSEQAALLNGCLELDAAAAEEYDKLVGEEDGRWASKTSKGYAVRESGGFINCSGRAEETAENRRSAIAQARRQKR